VSFHFIVRLQPVAGKEALFRAEVSRVVETTRSEPGCIEIGAFESVREPTSFAVHSEWVDESAFERHCDLPHTLRFLAASEECLTHPVEGLRSRQIAGGAGAAAAR